MSDENTCPLADDFEAAAMDARGKDNPTFMVELAWKAGLVISDALRSYFDVGGPQRCVVCDASRNTTMDIQLHHLEAHAQRLSYLMMGIEEVVSGVTGKPPPTEDEVLRRVVKTKIQDAKRDRRPTLRISDELRAVVRNWPEGSRQVKDQPPTPIPPDETLE